MSAKKKEMTRAERAIAFVHAFCRVPEGEFVGQPLILDEFQKKFYRDLFNDNRTRAVRRAIWSMGRKNAKTVSMATLLLVFLVGPEAKLNAQIESGAMSKDQAAKVFEYCCKIINLSPELKSIIRIIPSKKKLVGLRMNTTYTALSAEAKTAHGGSPLIVIVDELGQVIGPRSDFYDALVTSQGAHKNPLMVIISTQAPNDTDLLSLLIDDALAQKDDPDATTICHLYTAPDGCDIMDESAWYAANPALGKFLDINSLRTAAEEAQRMPSAEARFRNLQLNQRVTASNPFVSKNVWRSCGAPVDVQPHECEQIFGGLDLSSKKDLTAFILFGLKDGHWYVWCYFWSPERGLMDRAKNDRVPYDVWKEQGFLLTTPGATVDYEFVAQQIGEITAGMENLVAIAFDRWNMQYLKKEMERIGLELPMVDWGQGFKDMSPAIDSLESKILNGLIRHGNHPVLTMCAANAVITKDPAGGRKLDKTKTSGRIDGMVALAMAAGVAARSHELEGNLEDFIRAPLIL